MKKPLDRSEIPSAWFEKADHDLIMAEMAIREMEEVNDLISFHAQQCVEKYLKGALVFFKIKFPKTHDLSILYNMLKSVWPEMPFTGREVIRLTLYAITTQYPWDWDEVSKTEAIQAVEMAKRVKEAVLAFLKEKGYEG